MGDDLQRLIDKIMPCIEEHADGRNDRTRARREAMLLYFNRYVILHGSVRASMSVLLQMCVTTVETCSLAMQRLNAVESANALEMQIHGNLVDTASAIDAELAHLERSSPGGWTDADSARLSLVLERTFDWSNLANLRAYIYALTNEVLRDGLLFKERSMFMDAVQLCLERSTP